MGKKMCEKPDRKQMEINTKGNVYICRKCNKTAAKKKHLCKALKTAL